MKLQSFTSISRNCLREKKRSIGDIEETAIVVDGHEYEREKGKGRRLNARGLRWRLGEWVNEMKDFLNGD